MMFSNAKVNERVWSITRGWGTVYQNHDNGSRGYYLGIIFDSDKGNPHFYSRDGRRAMIDVRQDLYWDEIQITPPPKPKRMVKKTVEGFFHREYLKQGCNTINFRRTIIDIDSQFQHEFLRGTLVYEDEEDS